MVRQLLPVRRLFDGQSSLWWRRLSPRKTSRPAIREARLQDLDGLVDLEALTFHNERLTRRHFYYLLTRSHATTLVVINAGSVMGYASVAWRKGSCKAHLISIAVHPSCRGKGIGTKLLEACEYLARRRGCRSMMLEVRRDNRKAFLWYKRHLYSTFAVVPRLYYDGTTGYRMAKQLA